MKTKPRAEMTPEKATTTGGEQDGRSVRLQEPISVCLEIRHRAINDCNMEVGVLTRCALNVMDDETAGYCHYPGAPLPYVAWRKRKWRVSVERGLYTTGPEQVFVYDTFRSLRDAASAFVSASLEAGIDRDLAESAVRSVRAQKAPK